MDNRSEVRDFLTSRRARLTPDEVGLPALRGARRVPGMRREEVAMLAGVSVDYYVRLECGNLSGASREVLEALSQALRLGDAEHRHLLDLAAGSTPSGARPRRAHRGTTSTREIPLSLRTMLDALDTPAVVRDDRLTIVASNPLGRVLYGPLHADREHPANHARFVFLDDRSRDFWVDWERTADDTVGVLRTTAGRDPYDPELTALVGELSTRSEEFRRRWAEHHVHIHVGGTKRIHHPEVGDLELMYDSMSIAAAPGLTTVVYTAVPGSPSADALRLLGTLRATDDARRTGVGAGGH